jgi:hypothetical protein
MFAHELNLLVIGYAASQLGPDPIQTSSFTPCSHSRAFATTLADSVRRSLGISFQHVFINSLKVVRPRYIHTSQEQLEMITSAQTRLELSRSLKWSDFNGELNMSNPNPVNPTQPPYPTNPNPSPPANETSVQRAEREKREQDQRNR